MDYEQKDKIYIYSNSLIKIAFYENKPIIIISKSYNLIHYERYILKIPFESQVIMYATTA